MRDPSLFFLYSSVTRIKGVGGATVAALQRLLPMATMLEGSTLPTIRDLLFHLPVSIVDRRFTCPLNSAPDGVIATFVVKVDSHLPPPVKRRTKSPYKVLCSNDTGDITLVFFHVHEDYIKQSLPVGSRRVISGKTEHFDYRLQMTHPDIIAPVEKLAEVQKPEAVYPLTVGLTSRRITKLVEDALAKLPELPEWIASEWITSQRWPSWKTALQKVHHPETAEELLPVAPARQRLAYDEILANQLYMGLARRRMQQQAGEVIEGTGKLSEAMLASLPFALTNGQKKAVQEIYGDMASGRRMGRLLQGDVGSGKTLVAVLAMLRAVEQGLQTVLMVPTEIIAQQHYETISKMLALIKPSPLEGEGRVRGASRGYENNTLENAQDLRTSLTDAERILWKYLRNAQLEHYKFRRQQPIGSYIVDFFCAEKKLIIELDGGQHADQQNYDKKRTQYFESKGYHVLRFWNNEVLENTEGVYQAILTALQITPHPAPLPQGERGGEIALLTGSVKGKAREKILEGIGNGEVKMVVGTHALFQEQVTFKNLALIVIDEQHRFGVEQRMALSAKGHAPHVLHMTATPIPRSLTMTLYGDMDCSYLEEKPAGRQPIVTRVIPLSRYESVMERLQAALAKGEKAYWICPLIDDDSDNTETDLAAAELRFTEFKVRFGDIVGLVHGRMKAAQRDAEMRKFSLGESRLLVATTVVEVGVDVRDATIMVIEKAERFGLSQLHQLRGRVGRGEKPSACVLLYSDEIIKPSPLEGEGGAERRVRGGFYTPEFNDKTPLPNPLPQGERESTAIQRLSILRETDDGFKIAEEDLKIRGGGDLLGTRQSGLPRFIFTDLIQHQSLLRHAREDVFHFLKADPMLISERGQRLRILLQLFGFELQENASSAALG